MAAAGEACAFGCWSWNASMYWVSLYLVLHDKWKARQQQTMFQDARLIALGCHAMQPTKHGSARFFAALIMLHLTGTLHCKAAYSMHLRHKQPTPCTCVTSTAPKAAMLAQSHSALPAALPGTLPRGIPALPSG